MNHNTIIIVDKPKNGIIEIVKLAYITVNAEFGAYVYIPLESSTRGFTCQRRNFTNSVLELLFSI